MKSQNKYKAYIGSGNNATLIKNLIKRRFWWTVTDNKSTDINFVWTQLKYNDYFKKQDPC